MVTKVNNRMIDGAAVNVLDYGVSASNSATVNYTNLLAAITENFGGASKIVFTEDIEVDNPSGAACHIDFSTIPQALTIDTGVNWIRYHNAVRGGLHTGGSFRVGSNRIIENLNLDGGIYTVDEAQALSNISDPDLPVYDSGIQRGFYHQSQDDLIVTGALRVKYFRHFGFDITGDSSPTKSSKTRINMLEITDCFGYNYIMSALVRFDSVDIDTLVVNASQAAWAGKSAINSFPIIGFDIEPAKTNGSAMSVVNIDSAEVNGCFLSVFTDEITNPVKRFNLSNFTARNPDSVDSDYGLSVQNTAGNIGNVNITRGGSFQINENVNTDTLINTQTINFNNVHWEQHGYSGNLLKNASFDALTNWTQQGSAVNELVQTNSLFGANRLHLQSDSTGTVAGRRQDVPAIAGETYVYGCHGQTFGTNNGGNASAVSIVMSFRDISDVQISSKAIYLTELGNGYNAKSIATATAPAGTVSIRFQVYVGGSSSANADAYIDAVFLYQGFGYDRYTPQPL